MKKMNNLTPNQNPFNSLNSTKILSTTQIQALSSEYLAKGAFQDDFEIKSVEIEGKKLRARLKMTSFGISPSDTEGYHLTAPTVFRMVAQLVVIQGHEFLGFTQKTLEVWVREHYFKHRRPIRDPNEILLDLEISDIVPSPVNPDMLGFHFKMGINKNAVAGHGSAFFDGRSGRLPLS